MPDFKAIASEEIRKGLLRMEPLDIYEETDGALVAKLPREDGTFKIVPVGILLGICDVHSIVAPDEGAMVARWGICTGTPEFGSASEPEAICFDCIVKLGIYLGGAR